MDINVIIPCAGKSKRWDHHLGVHKQLAPIPGSFETILGRSVRLLQELGVKGISVITNTPEIEAAISGVSFIRPSESQHLSDTIYSSRASWGDRTVILLGDVIFTKESINHILRDREPVCFYGLLEQSSIVKLFGYRKEIFGFSFDRTRASQIEMALKLNSTLADIRDSGSNRWFWNPRRIQFLLSRDLRYPEAYQNKNELMKWFINFNYPPEPPYRWRQLSLSRTPAWRLVRLFLPMIGGSSMFLGKLWGVYSVLAQINPGKEPVRSRRNTNSQLFSEICDFTQDCDNSSDYERITLLQDFLNRY